MESLKNIVECLLFVADTPISLERFKDVLELEDTKSVRNALEQLATDYDHRQGGIFLSEVAGGYQIRTKPEYSEYVKRLLKPNPHRLSNAALETLAIVAYKQPVIRSDVEHLRGVDCGGVLRVLMEKKLIRVLGRKEIPGRPLIYATTKHFLEVFELKTLKDLPSPKEIEQNTGLPQEQLAAAALLTPNNAQEKAEGVPEAEETAPNDSENAQVDSAGIQDNLTSDPEASDISEEEPDSPGAKTEGSPPSEQKTPQPLPDNEQGEGKKT